MKRNAFLRGLIVAGAAMTFPFDLLAKKISRARNKDGFMVRSGEDRCGNSARFPCKVSTSDTDGDFYVVEQTRTTSGGARPHFHYEQDEWWYILKGEWHITIGDTTYEAKTGDCVFGPRMVPHSFKKIGTDEGKILIVFQPAGNIEQMFKDFDSGANRNLSDEERKVYTREKYRIEML